MEEKEKKVEIISKEEIEKAVNRINEAKEKCLVKEDSNLDLDKVTEAVTNLEGCSAQTVVGILTTSMLLLPAGAIMVVLTMGKQVLRAKALSELMDIVKKCPACSSEESPEATAE